jgi:2,2-dialkylglycine decarboxylase (pyruvate)
MEFLPRAGHTGTAISQKVTQVALDLGLSANITGAYTSGVIRLAPPITSTEEEIDFGLNALDTAIGRVVETLGS